METRQIGLVSALVLVLMIGAPSVYAETAFQSGYKHGLADGKLIQNCKPGRGCDPPADYIFQPGNGFAHHRTQFVDGYIKGWCLSHDGGGIEPNDGPEPTIAAFDCDEGLISATPNPSDWPK